MTRYTQSCTAPGNCWQTAVACILNVEPDTLPSQVEIEKRRLSYNNALNSYLYLHHGLCYSEVYDYQFTGLEVRRDWHMGHHLLVGPTERTATNGGINHVVVACQGEPVWDPHPSRAGLLSVERWGLLGHVQERQLANRKVQLARPDCCPTMRCLCPACAPEGLP